MRSIGLSSVMLIISVSFAQAQVINAQQVGGQGGGPFNDPCPSPAVMVGYNVISGKAMNTFAAVCQNQNNGVLTGNNFGLNTFGKDNGVGLGGAYHGFDTPRCPAGMAVTRMSIYVNKFDEIDSVAATCYPLIGSGIPAYVKPTETNGGKAVSRGHSQCPPHTIAVGITGRSGALIDSLGLLCSPFTWH